MLSAIQDGDGVPREPPSVADNSCRTLDCGGKRREPAAYGGLFYAAASSRQGIGGA
jgi:hypothetical protein